MERIIKICDKDYKMKASALTQFSYRNETGRSFLNDLKKLIKLDLDNIGIDQIDKLDDITELILQIAYVMVKEADKTQTTNYEEFLGSIDNLFDDTEWLKQVLQLACSPLSRQLQEN